MRFVTKSTTYPFSSQSVSAANASSPSSARWWPGCIFHLHVADEALNEPYCPNSKCLVGVSSFRFPIGTFQSAFCIPLVTHATAATSFLGVQYKDAQCWRRDWANGQNGRHCWILQSCFGAARKSMSVRVQLTDCLKGATPGGAGELVAIIK